ncbi:MAG: DUF547 domain-containing protein [Rhodospirillales bacterium]
MSSGRISRRRRLLRRGLAATAGSLVAAAPRRRAEAAPSADLWRRWLANQPAATAAIDHTPWDRLLAAYIVPGSDGITRFAYAALAASAGRRVLDDYVAALGRVQISSYARAEQLPFWLNLYNALTVKLILDHYPVVSIRDIDISPGLFAGGPWGKALIAVEGEPVGLDDIEHRILRPIWADPRIHYGVNCASLGCPNLPPQAFTALASERLLDEGASTYVNHPRGARVERGRLLVSSIYVWFAEDFGGNDRGVIAHLRRYAAPPLAQALESVEQRISGHAYNWSLNDAGRPRRGTRAPFHSL